MATRERFGSRLGFILVSAGCAIGLGNVWKFPYICGQYGGAIFIIIYLLFLLVLGLPIMVCEFSVGRGSQKSVAKSFHTLEPKGTKWHRMSWIGIAGCYLLMMFYTMVGGWMLYYCYLTASGRFTGADTTAVNAEFSNMLGDPKTMIFWTILTIVISFGICLLGMKNGVEKITKAMMICLFALMGVLVIHTITLDGAAEGFKFYLVPNVDAIKQHGLGTIIFAAMNQAFFTLSLGIGAMAIFGSYLEKDRSIPGEAMHICILDTVVALMAGMIVIPSCFAFGVAPDSGPSLIFITLPNIFANMAGGRIWGTMFFLFMSFAAFSTIIAVFENISSYAMDLLGWSRKKSVIVNLFAMCILCLPCIFGFNILSGFEPLGPGSNIMDLEDFLVSANLLPLGSVVYLLFCVKKNGWGWNNFLKEANSGKGLKFSDKLRGYLTYVLPVLVIIIYLKGYYDMFATKSLPLLIFWMCFAVAILAWIAYSIFYTPKNPLKEEAQRLNK